MDLYNYIKTPNMFKQTDLPRGFDINYLSSINNQYYEDGVICVEERNELTYMISTIRDFIQFK